MLVGSRNILVVATDVIDEGVLRERVLRRNAITDVTVRVVAPASQLEAWEHALQVVELELQKVAPEILLAGEMDLVLAGVEELPQLAEVEPLGRGKHCSYVAVGGLDDQGLRDVARRELERLCLRGRALGVNVRQELVQHARLVEDAR